MEVVPEETVKTEETEETEKTEVTERHSPVQAMSHNAISDVVWPIIAGEVVRFLTTHNDWCSCEFFELDEDNPPENESPCRIYGESYHLTLYACHICRTAWILTQVSPYIKACAQAHGRSQRSAYVKERPEKDERLKRAIRETNQTLWEGFNPEHQWSITNIRREVERKYERRWWHYEPQWWSQSYWSSPAGGGHFSQDWAASYWDDDWASSSWGDDWWSGTRWHW